MRKSVAIVASLAAVSLSACSVSSNSGDSKASASGSATAKVKDITLVTHESFVIPDELKKKFEKESGYTLKIQKSGDAGALANKLVLSKDTPAGDVVFGIDNTFASRVAKSGALADYTSSTAPASAKTYALPDGQGAGQLSPIDTADVCVNVDDAWFKKNNKPKPTSLDDLTKPEYKDLFVTEGAASSSPGMAFLLATIAKYGENGWESYWKKLMSNGTKLTSGWSDAWGVDYSAGDGKGKRPIVTSYNTSPTATLGKDGTTTTSILPGSCFTSNEYAGVLKGAKNEAGAKAFIDFLYGKDFQGSLPANMYVFPVDSSVALPKEWNGNVNRDDKPLNVSPADIDAKRQQWLTKWQDVTTK